MHTITRTDPLDARTAASAAQGAARGRGLLQTILSWFERHRQRQALLTLDDTLLRDIGLSRLDVMREAEKPIWRE